MTFIDPLKQAHDLLRAAVGPSRKLAHKVEGKLATAFREAMHLWDALKAKGGTMTDLVAGLEQTLRQHWPKGECGCPRCRWTCRDCEDIGAIFERRSARIYGGQMVSVVVPCHCLKGNRFRPKAVDQDDFRQAARSKPTRIGR